MCYMCSFVRIPYWVKVVAGCDETYCSLEYVTVEILYNWTVNSGNYHHGVELCGAIEFSSVAYHDPYIAFLSLLTAATVTLY